MADAASVLAIESVSRSFGRRSGTRVDALIDVSLAVEAGEILAVIGSSGAGKTTLANVALGLDHPNSGIVRWRGEEVRTLRRGRLQAAKGANRLITQDPFGALHPGMTVFAIVQEPLRRSSLPRGSWAAEVERSLDRVGLDPDVYRDLYPHQLSGGQRQRVSIARATLGTPMLLVADEPTSMLDVSVRAGITVLLDEIRAEQSVGILLITHDLGLARFVADRVVVLERGRIVETGAVDQVFADPQAAMTRALLGAAR